MKFSELFFQKISSLKQTTHLQSVKFSVICVSDERVGVEEVVGALLHNINSMCLGEKKAHLRHEKL